MNYEFFGVLFVLIIFSITLISFIHLFLFIFKCISFTFIRVYTDIFYLDKFRDEKLSLKEKLYYSLKIIFNFKKNINSVFYCSISNLYFTIELENRIIPKLIKHKQI